MTLRGGVAVTEPAYTQIWSPQPDMGTEVPGSSPLILGTQVQFAQAGSILGLQFIRAAGDTGNHLGWLRKIGPGTNSSPVYFHFPRDSTYDRAWNRAYFCEPVGVLSGDIYKLILEFGIGDYIVWQARPGLPWTWNTDYTITGSFLDTTLVLNPTTSQAPVVSTLDVIWLPPKP